jgi:hypothetical protein
MEKEFAPNFTAEDMVNLGFTQMYLKLMIDGIGSRPFSASSLPPIPKPSTSYVQEIIAFSRKHFSGEREKVEVEIQKWTNKDFNLESQKVAPPKPKPKNPEPQPNPQTKTENIKNNNIDKENSARIEIQKILEEVAKAETKVVNKEFKKEDRREEKREERKDEKLQVKNNFKSINRNNLRRKVFLDLQKEHALLINRRKPASTVTTRNDVNNTDSSTHKNRNYSQNGFSNKAKGTFPKREVLDDEVPEDVLKALLDMGDL